MTREEAIKDLIDIVKNGVNNPLDAYCYSNPCINCPFHNDKCVEAMVGGLVDALIKAEEQNKSFEKTCYKLQQALEKHQETNLEHYYGTADIIVSTNINDIPILAVCEHAEKAYEQSETNIVDWLLSPYEEPPKYKLSQFEYDLIQSFNNYTRDGTIYNYGCLTDMQEKGYFKGISSDIPFEDILTNCEVVEE